MLSQNLFRVNYTSLAAHMNKQAIFTGKAQAYSRVSLNIPYFAQPFKGKKIRIAIVLHIAIVAHWPGHKRNTTFLGN